MTYKVQINDLVRNATPEEVAAIEAHNAEIEQQAQNVEQMFAAKQSARLKLKSLGLTDAEIFALVG